MKKRILATLLALTMSLSVTSAFASEAAGGAQGGQGEQGETNIPGEDTDLSVEFPTATVTELDVDELAEEGLVDLTYALRFEADEATEEQLDAYGDWYADFVLTLNKDATFSADDETADGYLAGFYSSWSENWVKVPPADFNTNEPRSITVEAGEEIRIMETAADMMGEPGLKYTYAEVYEVVNVFDCGAYFTPEFLAANPDLNITLELRIYNNEDESEFYVIGGETYEFKVVEFPTATVTELDVDDLTYALRFTADEATEEQLAAYGDWNADFVLTINKDATFIANEDGSNNYLAGRYQGYEEGSWLKVPFETASVNAGEETKIMAFANATITYQEIYDSVGEFDCGIYFTPEFLEANPDLETTLELRIYHPESESVNYKIGESHTFVRKATTTEENVVIQGTTSSNSNTVVIETVDTENITADTETVTIDTNDFAEEDAVIDSVTIPASAITDIKQLGDNAELNVTLANGEDDDITVSVNKDALEAIVADLPEDYEGSLTLKVEETEDLTLNQDDTVENLANNVVYKIVLETEDGDEIYTTPDASDERKIVINIYYEKNNSAGDVVVKHLKDNGTLENVPFTYENNIITMTLSHFSDYVIYQKKLSSAGSSLGGGSVTQYTVQFDTDGGSKVENQKITKNSKVEEPATPTKNGFTFEGWYTDKDFTTLYDFETEVTKGFTLYAKWTEETKTDDEQDNVTDSTELWFDDVSEADWYYADVKYVSDNKLMNGIADTTFAPNGLLTRAMLVTILYRNEGEPAVNRSIPFADIDMGAYYANAVVWAQQNQIVNGISETEFAPDANITREQIAAILFRYAQFKGMDAVTLEENLHFDDSNEISEYAVSAMNWAVGTGLLKGKTDSTLNPLDNATRAEIAAILHRFIEANK